MFLVHRPRGRTLSVIAFTVIALLAASCSSSGSNDATGTTSDTSGGSASTDDLSQHVSLTGVPGVTDDQISYSMVGTDTNNPLGTCILPCFEDGVRAYFDWRNSEGGIWGRQLNLSEVKDDALANNQSVSLEILSADDTFGTFDAPLLPAGWPDLAAAGVPLYTLAIHPTDGEENIFGNSPANCYDCTTRGAAYAASLAGAKKVGVLGYGSSENSKLCAESQRASIEKYSSDIGGAEVAYFNDDLAFGLPNGVGPEVTALKNAGVDYVTTCLDLNGMKSFAQEMTRQGIRDQVTMLHPNSYDQKFIAASGGLFQGDYVTVSFRPFESASEGSQLDTFKEWMDKSGKPLSEHAMIGWINADLAYQGLKAAGPEFSRQKVIDATNQLTTFTADGLVPPIDWSRQHQAPTEADPATHGSNPYCVALVQVEGDGFTSLDTAKPWACWPGDTRDWSTPTPTNFN